MHVWHPLSIAFCTGVLCVGSADDGSAASVKLQQVSQADTIGAQIPYLEGMIGPAWKVSGVQRLYKVDGCIVGVGTHGAEIRNLSLSNLSPNCQFGLSSFVGDFAPHQLLGMTFGDFENSAGQGRFESWCIYLCGNATDPVVYDRWAGPHAVNFLEIQLEVVLVDKAAIDASMAWADLMRRQSGDNYVVNTKFNCDATYDAAAHQLFSNVPITGITVGYDLPPVTPQRC
jgi:hypothetical protein